MRPAPLVSGPRTDVLPLVAVIDADAHEVDQRSSHRISPGTGRGSDFATVMSDLRSVGPLQNVMTLPLTQELVVPRADLVVALARKDGETRPIEHIHLPAAI